MQSLWGRILAGEANRSGSFSKRTLRLVADLNKADAELFTSLCRFGWVIGDRFQPLVYNLEDQIYKDHQLNFGVLTHLDDIGLISFNNLSGFQRTRVPREFVVGYRGQGYSLSFAQDDNALQVGKVLLSQPGSQLASICSTNGITELPGAVIINVDGKDYAVNGMAGPRHPPIERIWNSATHPEADLGRILTRGLTLCDW